MLTKYYHKHPLIFTILIYIVLQLIIWNGRWNKYGFGDWDLTYYSLGKATVTYKVHKQILLWDPWTRGGKNNFADPQHFNFSLVFLLSLIMPLSIAFKIEFVLLGILSIATTFWLMRCYFKLPRERATLIAIIYTFTPTIFWHYAFAGHENTIGLFLLPVITLTTVHSWKRKYFIILTALAFVLLKIYGNTYTIIWIALFIFLFTIAETQEKKTLIKRIYYLIIAGFLSIIFVLWKIIPEIKFMSQHNRTVSDMSKLNLIQGISVLTGILPENKNHSYSEWYGPWEYGFNVPIIFLILLLYNYKKIDKKLWIFFLIFFWLGLGNFPNKINPWFLLAKYIPPFTYMRVPARTLFYASAVIMLYALPKLHKITNRKMFLLLLIFWATENFLIDYNIVYALKDSKDYKPITGLSKYSHPPKYTKSPNPEEEILNNRFKSAKMFDFYFRKNLGLMNSYDPIISEEPFDAPEYPGTVSWLTDTNVKIIKWTPNYFILKFPEIPYELVLNQAYDEQWKSEDAILQKYDNRLKIIAEKETVKVYFSPY